MELIAEFQVAVDRLYTFIAIKLFVDLATSVEFLNVLLERPAAPLTDIDGSSHHFFLDPTVFLGFFFRLPRRFFGGRIKYFSSLMKFLRLS